MGNKTRIKPVDKNLIDLYVNHLKLLFVSPQTFTEPDEDVAETALVPPAGLSCTCCAPDSSFISSGGHSRHQSTDSQAMAVPEPEQLTGRTGKHSSTDKGLGGELLPHR